MMGSPTTKVIDTSIMAVARQKYSDYTLQEMANKNLQSRYNKIAEKIDILRHSNQLTKGYEPSKSNSKLLNAVKKR